MSDDGTQTYRVIHLFVENYKKLVVADVTPARNAMIVAGRNRQGKTSLLDAIAAVLGGKRQMAQRPLRIGAESGQIVCVLGDTKPELLVKRIFDSSGKTVLEITSAEGYKAPSPQAILDQLCGAIAFDPLSFIHFDEKSQVETLRKLVGLDFTVQDQECKRLYDARTVANRQAKALLVHAEIYAVPLNTPTIEVSVESLLAEQNRMEAKNRGNQAERNKVQPLADALARQQGEAEKLEILIHDLEAKLSEARNNYENAKARIVQAVALLQAVQLTAAVLKDEDIAAIQRKIVDAQTINRNVNMLQQRQAVMKQKEAVDQEADELTTKIEAIDNAKQQSLATVAWPIEGLAFGDEGVIYNGVPFSQASGAEQLSVSFAMSAALNPRLKVALIRNASLLDEEQMAIVRGLAEKYDTQIWLEVVQNEAGPCGVLIEEGKVVEGGSHTESQTTTKLKQRSALVEQAADNEAEWNGNGVVPQDESDSPFLE